MTAQSKPPLLIVGTGAMACLFGARLSDVADVTMLGTWPQGLAALREQGIRLVEPDGTEHVYRVAATDDPGACRGANLALVLVKSWQTARAAAQLKECLGPEGVALTLQNGLGNREALAGALGEARVAQGVTTNGATLLGPGRVRAGGSGPTHAARHERIAPLLDLFREAGLEIDPVDDLEGLVWGKLAINAGINPLTALLEVPNGALLDEEHAEALMRAAAVETAAVAAERGVKLPYEDAGAAVAEVARRTAANRSSMLQDVQRGAPTEIDAICGAVARAGEQVGVPAPVNRTLWHLVRARLSADQRRSG